LIKKSRVKVLIKKLLYDLAAYSGIDVNSIDLLAKFYNFYGHKNKGHIFFLFLGAVVSGVLELLGILLLYVLIRTLIDIKYVDGNHWLLSFFNSVGLTDKSLIIPFFAASILFVFVLKNIYIMFYYHLQHLTLRKWKNGISTYLMERYLFSPYSFLLSYNSATVIRNVNTTVSSALNGFVLAALNYGANIVTGMVILSLLYTRYLGVTLIIGGILVISTVIQNRFLKKKQRQLGREKEDLASEQTKSVYQGLHALKETKVVGKERYFLNIFKHINAKTIDNEMKSLFLSRLPAHLTEIVIIISTIVITIYVLFENVENTSVSVSSLGVLGAIAFRLAPIMNRIVSSLQSINKNQYSMLILFNEIDKLRSLTMTIGDRSNVDAMIFKDKIELLNVNFAYPTTKKVVLKDVTLTIKKGEFVGLVGTSGAGKTTLVDIILGLLSPTKGEIAIDGTLLNTKNIRSWQNNIGYVPQSVFMSDGTIAENIAFGVDADKIDLDLVKKCVETVKLDQYVNELPQGINFIVGENGKKLSGGQKQRLGIARALYLKSDVLVLDEATSSLDVPTEVQISSAIQKIRGEKTIIVIAHRLSTIFDADKIVFIEDGEIVDVGTYSELFLRNKKFNELGRMAKVTPDGFK